LDQAELLWWQRYADVEDTYCWVQTPAVQRLIRGHYLRSIVRGVPAGGRVLEIGCGSGWLSLLLARYGASSVEGVDPSPEQIARAREDAAKAGFTARVRFRQTDISEPSPAARDDEVPFDAVVLHAVLHHLSDEEIQRLLETLAGQSLHPDARVFILEPISYRAASDHRTRLDRCLDRLILLPRAGKRLGIRKVNPEERALTERIDERGDSPKEGPFQPGELEALMEPYLEIRARRPVLNFSYLGAKNALLMGISHPTRARLLLRPYLWLLRSLERWVLRLPPGATWLPQFVLFECRVRDIRR